MVTQKNFTSFIFFFFAAMLVSCATAPEKSKMVPYIDYSTFVSSSRTLTIKEVKGGEETGWDTPRIDNKDFKEALIAALKKSGLFKEIFTENAGDYELYATIISQKVVPGISAYTALLVHYRMVDTKTNQDILTENIFSQINAFGENLGKDAIEAAARDNLAQLIRKLNELFTKQEKK
jgi:hypothetical protein